MIMSFVGKDAAVEAVFAEWMRRLRSGDYKQTNGVLCRIEDDGSRSYCCLGVLTEMATEAGLVREVITSDGLGVYYINNEDPMESDNSGLLRPVRKWADVASLAGNIYRGNPTEGKMPNSLAGANDGWHWSFEQIADLAEENRDLLREETRRRVATRRDLP